MPLSALNHKKLAAVVPASSQLSDVLDALYTALTAATYYDASGRTAGVGSAVKNVAKYQNAGVTEAVYGEFAGADMAGVKFIFAGQNTAAKTPTFLTPDSTLTSNHILCSIVRNAGAFNAWDAAAPFTSGDFPGYWKCGLATNVTSVDAVESQDTVWVVFRGAAGTTVYAAALGGLWDPDSTHASDSELNGRRIGMIVTGTSAIVAYQGGQIWGRHDHVDQSNNAFLNYNSTNGGPHAGVLNLGLATVRTVDMEMDMQTVSSQSAPASSGLLPSGKVAKRMVPIYIEAKISNGEQGTANTIGRLREAYIINPTIAVTRATEGGSDSGYVISGNHVSAQHAFMLAA